jgi:hypothetical protein
MIKSYRGLLADNTIATIPLHTNDGKIGYRIKKLELFPSDPTATNENIIKVFSVEPTTTSTDVDFEDGTLLAVAMWSNSNTTYANPDDMIVVFDNAIFNQDIYVAHRSSQGGLAVNYYIELEQMDLTEDQALVAIVKNLRNEQ